MLQTTRKPVLSLLFTLFCFLSHSRPGQADECQPVTWGKRDLQAVAELGKLPALPNQSSEWGSGGPKVGDLVCRFYHPTAENVNYYTCSELAEMAGISNEQFFALNPSLNPDCSNIKPITFYCIDGYVEPLRARDGKCGPPNKNATCRGTGLGVCCNSKTWTCGDEEEDCSPGICYEGECPGHEVFSTDGKCGPQNGNRGCGGQWGECCNLDGQCGFGDDFCKAGVCTFGNCTAKVQGPPSLGDSFPWTFGNTTDGTCGSENGYTCGIVSGNCCNKDGRCGSLPSDCGQGCQPLYGKCNDRRPPLSTAVFDNFDQNMNGWMVYDGSFAAGSGKLVVDDSQSGKAVYDASFDDFILEADISLSKAGGGNAGFIFRATQLGKGPDAYQGYYVGISTGGTVVIGRADGGWTSLSSANVAISANQMYHIKVQAISALITVFVDDMTSPKITVLDTTFARGAAGVRNFWTGATVKNFAISLAFADDFGSDLSGWKTYDGKFEATLSGMIASDTWSGKAVYVATFQDFVLEANLALSKAGEGNAGLIFRATELGSGADAYHGYYAGVGTDGTVTLGRADGGWQYLASAKVEIIANQVIAMKIRAIGELIEVFVDDADAPKISFRDSTFKAGSAGVRVFQTGARLNSFKIQPVFLERFDNKDMVGWKTLDGQFMSGSGELVASNANSGKAIYDTTVKDFVLESNITLTKSDGNAGLIFRATSVRAGADSYSGYFAGIDPSGWLVLGRADGSWKGLQSVSMSIAVNKQYHLKVKALGGQIQVFLDDMSNPKISVRDEVFLRGAVGVRIFSTSAKYENFMVQNL